MFDRYNTSCEEGSNRCGVEKQKIARTHSNHVCDADGTPTSAVSLLAKVTVWSREVFSDIGQLLVLRQQGKNPQCGRTLPFPDGVYKPDHETRTTLAGIREVGAQKIDLGTSRPMRGDPVIGSPANHPGKLGIGS